MADPLRFKENDNNSWHIRQRRDLDKAIERLARAGFQDTVYDEAIVGEEPSGGGPVVFAPAMVRRRHGAAVSNPNRD